jgi:tetratricopeptide (TPR) repeat protein
MKNLTMEDLGKFNKLYETATARCINYILKDNNFSGHAGWLIKMFINQSIGELRQCLEIIPNNICVLFILGKCYQTLGEYNFALQFFEKGLAAEFTFEEDFQKYQDLKYNFILEASVVYARTGNFEKAIELSNLLLNTNPENVNVLTFQAMNFIISENDSEADRLLERALTIDPNKLVVRKVFQIQNKIQSNFIPRPRSWSEITDSVKIH